MYVSWWLVKTPTHPLCFICLTLWLRFSNKHCSTCRPPVFAGVFRLWWKDCPRFECNLWARAERQVQLVLLTLITDFCKADFPCFPIFSVICADLHTFYLFVYVSACLSEQQCIHRLEQFPFFTRKDFAGRWWWEQCSCNWVNILMQEKALRSPVFLCVCVFMHTT